MTEPSENTTTTNLKKYLWRFMPTDAKAETMAPDAPTTLSTKARTASISLNWTAPDDEDIESYTILRNDGKEWNTIGRNDTITSFTERVLVASTVTKYGLPAFMMVTGTS